MSYDFDVTPATCGHEQTRERYIIDISDSRTLLLQSDPAIRMRAPVNGVSTIKVFIGGNLIDSNHPVYGYDVVLDELSLADSDQRSKIVFKNVVRTVRLLIEVSYITEKPYCLRCYGTGAVADLKPAKTGSCLHITKLPKLAQKCLKFVLTSKCEFYPTFTCQLKEYIGKKVGIYVTTEDISFQVSNALSSVLKIQASQRTIQRVDPQEMLKGLDSVQSFEVAGDPCASRVEVKVSAYTGEKAPLNFRLRTRN